MSSRTALLVIDVQRGLEDGQYYGNMNNPQITHNIPALLDLFRSSNKPIFHVKHNSVNEASPLHPSKPSNAFYDWAVPQQDEPVFEKTVNSAFIGTRLEETLRRRDISALVVCGLTTNHCVSTSVRMASNLGFEVLLVGDACATCDRVGPDGVLRLAEDMHMYSLTSLHGEFCEVVNTKDVGDRIKAAA
ncbi:Isochorismatase-like hydrolase [Melanogaster broomeanus]|nr:Isochorismatase-like hydrolase [Melanogaster broomeanus]